MKKLEKERSFVILSYTGRIEISILAFIF